MKGILREMKSYQKTGVNSREMCVFGYLISFIVILINHQSGFLFQTLPQKTFNLFYLVHVREYMERNLSIRWFQTGDGILIFM